MPIRKGRSFFLPVFIIILVILAMNARYLMYGVPHEYLGPEFKGTFEGDYDFTLELVKDIATGGTIPLWSSTYSGPAFVFAANLHFGRLGLIKKIDEMIQQCQDSRTI